MTESYHGGGWAAYACKHVFAPAEVTPVMPANARIHAANLKEVTRHTLAVRRQPVH
ncbi:MAG: hypothetical protein IT310_15190 [Anaerolineales bacterium]|nr:hypothetical protein [Anaerolineales bacterium]